MLSKSDRAEVLRVRPIRVRQSVGGLVLAIMLSMAQLVNWQAQSQVQVAVAATTPERASFATTPEGPATYATTPEGAASSATTPESPRLMVKWNS
jgi:hypothetical protein